MKTTEEHNQKIASLRFGSVYSLYVAKITRKGRTIEELNAVISWLTGFSETEIEQNIQENPTFETFFNKANLHSNAILIKGVICGYRVEEIENPLTQKIRYLDKLIDELAKGKKLEKILIE